LAFGYRPALDGIRAWAVIAVLICHAPVPHGEGGALGVDVFFVLSGYLITSLLAAEVDRRGSVAFGRFYMRRAWRLWPPLLALLLLASLLPQYAAISPAPIWQSDLVAVSYLSNWWPHIASGHSLGYLSHTWSLSVEEQFYLFWPVLLTLLLRRRLNPWWLLAPTGVLVLLRTQLVDNGGLLPGRFDGLLMGALVVLLARNGRLPRVVRTQFAAWAGGGVVAASMLFASATHSRRPEFDVAITGAALGSAVLIASLTTNIGSPADRFLSPRPLVEIGKLSYTIYLLHYPIFLWVSSKGVGRAASLGLDLLFTVPAVAACWLLVERPARRMKARWSTIAATDAVAAAERSG
jgi:peptidoglycan/LPS O-acetylase OafA/YrhL